MHTAWSKFEFANPHQIWLKFEFNQIVYLTVEPYVGESVAEYNKWGSVSWISGDKVETNPQEKNGRHSNLDARRRIPRIQLKSPALNFQQYKIPVIFLLRQQQPTDHTNNRGLIR
jgi:hypothetical protein